MTILGIETSCDETAAGIVVDGRQLTGHIVASQVELHNPYGGVVPEIAARSHVEGIIPVVDQALKQARLDWDQIDGIGVTHGAGLAGSLLVGVVTAQALATVHNKPLWACNHVEGHVYANFITDTSLSDLAVVDQAPGWPLLALIVSGKHSQLALFNDHFHYRLLGQANDDAIGEAFDKIGRLLGLDYPGGPAVAQMAVEGDDRAFDFPIARLQRPYDFSFSGLKTAVLRQAQKLVGSDWRLPSRQVAVGLSQTQIANLAASFERVAVATVVAKTIKAYHEFQPKSVVIAGGVAANQRLRRELRRQLPIEISYADPSLCTDNGAMIASLAGFQALGGQPPTDPTKLQIDPSLVMVGQTIR